MTDILLRREFLVNARGFTFGDSTGVTWTFDSATNKLTLAITAGAVGSFDEAVDDRVAALMQDGTGISWSYNDGANTLTPTVTLAPFSTTNLAEGANLYFTDERAQDAVGAALTDSSSIDFTYNDGANTITATVIESWSPTWTGTHTFSGPAINITTGYVDWTGVSTPSAPASGHVRLYADTSNAHTRLEMVGSDGTELRICRDNVLLVRNTSGSPMTKGQLANITGSTGQIPNVGLASASAFTTHAEGMVFESIANNGFGYIMVVGLVTGLDTHLIAEGTRVYLDTTSGAYTTTAPAGPNIYQEIGVVTNSHATQGSIEVNIGTANHNSANPSASVGLTAVNGSSQAFMRADAAPALSQSIAPTWSGQHQFSLAIRGPDGTASAPAFTFTNDTNTGIYSASGDNMGFAAGGAVQMQVSSALQNSVYSLVVTAGLGTSRLQTDANSHILQLQGGYFDNSGTEITAGVSAGWLSGIVINARNSTATGGEGVSFWTRSTKQVAIDSAAVTSALPLLGPAGAVGAPAFSFSGDPDTGLYNVSANVLAAVVGGTVSGKFESQKFTVGDGTTTATFTVNGAAGQTRDIVFYTNASNRWILRATSTAEAGSNAGSDFQIIRRADDGTSIANALQIIRSSGNWSLGDATNNPTFTTLGTGSFTFGGVLLGAAGSASAPEHSFSGDTNTGMYSAAADDLGFATGGTLRVDISTTAVTSTLVLLGPAGSNTAPTHSFSGDPDTGMYDVGANQLGFATGGSLWAVIETDGRLYGKALHNNVGAVTGTTNQYIASGTYTPSLTNTTNVAASTARQCSWIRVGNVVTVAGELDVDVTSAVATLIGISLPIASTFTTAFQCGGVGAAPLTNMEAAAIDADSTNHRAQMRWVAVNTANHTMCFTFTYEVV